MKVYVGLDDGGRKRLYVLSRKPFRLIFEEADGHTIGLTSGDRDDEVVVCPAVWHRLGGVRLKLFESRCIDLTLVIKPINHRKKGA